MRAPSSFGTLQPINRGSGVFMREEDNKKMINSLFGDSDDEDPTPPKNPKPLPTAAEALIDLKVMGYNPRK